MNKVNNKRTFFELFETVRPVLKVLFNVNSTKEPTEVEIENRLERNIDVKGIKNLEKICKNPQLAEFLNFYTKCNGFSLATPVLPENVKNESLLIQFSVNKLVEFTELYLLKGKLAWTIDSNKSKILYRGENKWLAFALVNSGPSCLTIFLDGEYAGNVFLVTPQPHFNILKPIAKTFNGFLERVAKDPAAFFKLTKSYVTIVGQDNQNYGYLPLEYIDSGGILFPEKGEKVSLESIRNKDNSTDKIKTKWWKF